MFRNLLLSTFSFFALASADAMATSWDLASEYPATSLHGQVADKFAAAVADKTGGSLEITVHHGGALGYKSLDHFDAVGDGALQAASSAFVFWPGIDPIFQLSSLPFLAPTTKDVHKLYELARPDYDKVFADNNQMLLLAAPWPSSGLWGNKAFEKAADLAQVKVRTYDVGSTEVMKNAGAFPIQISWSDVPAQLSTNAIDAVLTSANGGIGIQMWELQSHFTNVNYAASLQGVHVNLDAFNDLTPDEQSAVKDAAREAEDYGWSLLEQSMAKDFATLREHGVTVTETVPADFSAFLTAAAKPFIDKWIDATGDRATRIMDAYNGK
ncbi:TRAP transporter substrate-binding protein [uncultured Cohaesibacter sp.]|uniref:TRAP transporter substrate-binding protein n=1 Tax=uncultured Cohaesibacter sp. TaxID=1002546 RepID=UPI0029C7C037|nr:TRAP transporter substrate-binding protein [uncultured Cohaesibacter sp.]